jgi:N-carbamoylputrescine amidase
VRVTVCELPHETGALEAAWAGLCEHTRQHRSELVLLPELAFVEAVWRQDRFDAVRWSDALARSEEWLRRLPELDAPLVVGTGPMETAGRRFNQGFLWSPARGAVALRRKYFLPEEPGWWERLWFERGDPAFPAFRAGDLSFGLSICTELWALENCAAYSAQAVGAILTPRATGAATIERWLSAGVVTAVRSGAYSVSSNRVDRTGGCGGVGWIVSPTGEVLARTSAAAPFATIDIGLAAPASARAGYPGYVFAPGRDISSRPGNSTITQSRSRSSGRSA